MATFLTEESRTFNEYLLIPRLTTRECTPDKITLKTPLVRHKVGEEAEMYLNIPFTSAIMQSVSGEEMGVALAREGGIAFIYVSQSIEIGVRVEVRKEILEDIYYLILLNLLVQNVKNIQQEFLDQIILILNLTEIIFQFHMTEKNMNH